MTPLEMANAYATFASGGQWSEPRIIVAYGNEPVPAPEMKQVLKPETAYVVTSLMRSVVEIGTARSAAGKLKRPAAGKTGTTDEDRDAWFVGFTPELLAAVWVGFDERRTLGTVGTANEPAERKMASGSPARPQRQATMRYGIGNGGMTTWLMGVTPEPAG